MTASERCRRAASCLRRPPHRLLRQSSRLTEGQRGVWLTTQMGADASCAFNESVLLDLAGPLSEDALVHAAGAVVSRHEALRTAILPDGEGQKFLPSVSVAVPVSDLSALAPAEREAREAETLAAEAGEPFNLAEAPLIRFRLIRRSAEVHRLVVTAHHLVCDGWSFGVLLCDLADAYTAFTQGTLWAPPAAASFQSYAETPQTDAENHRYWRQQLSPPPAPLRLPAGRARPALSSYRGARKSRRVPAALASALRQLCGVSGTTPSAALLSAYTLLLHGLSGTRDAVVWVPSAGQALEENPELDRTLCFTSAAACSSPRRKWRSRIICRRPARLCCPRWIISQYSLDAVMCGAGPAPADYHDLQH